MPVYDDNFHHRGDEVYSALSKVIKNVFTNFNLKTKINLTNFLKKCFQI